MSSVPHPLDPLAEEFVARLRKGERPSLTEYVERHPELAEQIRALFPTLLVMEQAADQQTLPERLGEYRMLRELGRGGMGIVYEAVQEPLGRHVALKVLPAHVQLDPMLLERFQREASAAARLQHAHIVPVYGVGQQNGVHYYAMQYVAGRGLDQVLSVARARSNTPPLHDETPPTGALPSPAAGAEAAPAPVDTAFRMAEPATTAYFRQVAQLGVEAADALAYAHRQGVLHRDIKPANLMLDRQGHVWVTDFGLAKAEGLPELTQTGDIVGTLRYMAPEQFNGNAETRSDLYSLGLTLYELLTLRPAFDETDRAKLIKQMTQEEPPRPRLLQPGLPRDLETVVLKAIAREPERRYPTGDELADDLRRFLADEPVQARRSSLWERGWRWGRRNPVLAALTTSVAVLLLVVAAGSLLGMVYLSATLAESEKRRERAETAERQEAEKLFDAYLGHARGRRTSGRIGQRYESLKTLHEALALAHKWRMGPERFLEIRNEVIACLAVPDVRLRKEWEGWDASGAVKAAFDQDMTYCAQVRAGTIIVRRVADDEELARLPSPGGDAFAIRFSRNQQWLGAWYSTSVKEPAKFRIWDWRLQKVVFQPADARQVRNFAFHPDSRQVALVGSDKTIHLYELPGGKETGILELAAPTDYTGAFAFNPDGSLIALHRGQAQPLTVGKQERSSFLEVRETATNRLIHRWGPSDSITQIVWQPHGFLIAALGYDNRIHLWDARTGKQHEVLRTDSGQVSGIAFSAQGDLLFTRSREGVGYAWDPWRGDCLLALPVTSMNHDDADSSFILGWCNNRVAVWDLAPRSAYRVLASHRASHPVIISDSVSHDGRWLVLSHYFGARLWDVHRGVECEGIPSAWGQGLVCHPSAAAVISKRSAPEEPVVIKRWPYLLENNHLRVGPPENLGRVAVSYPGPLAVQDRLVAFGSGMGAHFLSLEEHRRHDWGLLKHPRGTRLAISPSNRWLVSGSPTDLNIWDLPARTVLQSLQVSEPKYTTLTFSPCERWLVTADRTGYDIWQTGTWQRARRVPLEDVLSVPPLCTFTRAGNLLALRSASDVIRLIDVRTWQDIARLQMPAPSLFDWMQFASNDSQLLVGTKYQPVPHAWDLALIRSQLAAMGLDWDAPPYPPAKWTADTPPVRVEVIGAD